MSLPRKIAKNITANYFGVTGQIVIAFFLSPFLVHTLGDTRYGVWTVIAAMSGYMSLLDLGVASALTRYIARFNEKGDHESINRIVSSSLFIFVCVSLLIIASSPWLADLLIHNIRFQDELRGIIRTLIIITAFDMALFVSSGIFRGAFGGFQRFEIINVARLLSLLIKSIAFYFFLLDGYGLIAMSYISIVANLIIVFFYIYMLKKYYGFVHARPSYVDKKHVSMVLHYSKYVFITMVAGQLLNYSSSFVVGYFLSAAAITWFSIPLSLAEYVKQLCLAVSSTYIPVFSQLDGKQDHRNLSKYYLTGTRYIMIFSNLLCIGMIVLGPAFIAIWMGEKYAAKSLYLIFIMFIALYFIAPHLIGYALLQGMSRHRWYAYTNVFMALASLVMSIVMAKPYGLEGVALGMAIPQIVFCGVILPTYIARIFQFKIIDYLIKTHGVLLPPSLLLTGALLVMKYFWQPEGYFVLILEACIAAALYLFLIYWLTLDKTEKTVISKVWKKLTTIIV